MTARLGLTSGPSGLLDDVIHASFRVFGDITH
jgi:hypothetical protein